MYLFLAGTFFALIFNNVMVLLFDLQLQTGPFFLLFNSVVFLFYVLQAKREKHVQQAK